MKIKALIEKLSQLNPEHEIIMSSDGEGNSFSPLDSFSKCQYVPERTWCGEAYFGEDCEEENAICLWPIN